MMGSDIPAPSGRYPPAAASSSRLERISTQWPLLSDPTQFVLRYGPAIRKYLRALVRNPLDAEEVEQDFLLKVVERGFDRASPDRGRFRDYLKVAVRNAAMTHLRRRSRPKGELDVEAVAAPDPTGGTTPLEEEWTAEWRTCILDRAWRELDAHEQGAPGSLYYSVLRASVDHADEDSEALAARVAEATGRPLRADAFRKQVSRARRMFAKMIVAEVAETIESATPERIEDELIDLGLMRYVQKHLPPDWREKGVIPDAE